jgi:YHS domain-containing protein
VLRALLEAIVLLLIVRAAWKLLGGIFTVTAGARRTTATGEPRQPPARQLVRDPVCGTYVSPDSAISDGKNYFCSEKCRDEYRSGSRATETQRHRG